MIRRTSIYTALVSLALVSTQAIAQQIDFETQVWPILQSNCFDCHGETIHEGNLRLDAKTLAFRGGITGIGIVTGKPDQSPLYLRLVTEAEGERMPAESEALAEDQIDVIRQWIEQGAKWPDSVGDWEVIFVDDFIHTRAVEPMSIPTAGTDRTTSDTVREIDRGELDPGLG